jgi:GNAT superfamily N-acetyltransferase
MRAIRPDDKERLRAAFERLSARSVYRRFHCSKTALTTGELRRLTELDFVDHVGLTPTIENDGGVRLIAVGRFARLAPGADAAELAFTVDDEYQHRGAATLLLEQLVRLARNRGVRTLVANLLEDNDAMHDVLEHSGLPLRQIDGRGVRRVEMTIGPGDPAVTHRLEGSPLPT